MKRIVFFPDATTDLDSIWDYTADKWGTDQANRYVEDIRIVVEKLGTDVSTSHSAADVRKGYRKTFVGRHVIFFREGADIVEVVRVLHQQMDVGRWV